MDYYVVSAVEAVDQVFVSREDAIQFAREWAILGLQRVTMKKTFIEEREFEVFRQYEEGPSCGVCDGLGHTTENCRAGDIRDHCPEWAM